MGVLRKILDKFLEAICCTLLALMTLTASWQVISRYVLNNPSTATEELTLIAFVWTSLFAAAYVFGKQDHMKVTFILDKFGESNRIKLKMFAEIIILGFAALVLIFGGFKMCGLSMAQASSSLQIPMGYIYLALPFSGLFTCAYNLLNLSSLKEELNNLKSNKSNLINLKVKKTKKESAVGGRK